MNNPKAKCYFCPFRASVKLFHYMFNGKPVCVCCAAKRRENRERPVFHGRPEFFTREEALVRLQEVRRAQRDIGYEKFKEMVAALAIRKEEQQTVKLARRVPAPALASAEAA